MEVWVLSEPRAGGNTRTFAGVPALNPPENPSSCRTCQSRQSRGLGQALAQLRRDRCRMPRYFERPYNSQPHRRWWRERGAVWFRADLAAILQKELTSGSFQGVGEANSFSGLGSLRNCFPNVWGLALGYMFCP